MKDFVNKHVLIAVLLFGLVSFASCTKDEGAGRFSIIGPWGMVSGTITDGDGKTTRYDSMGTGYYYEYMEFKADGTLIRTALPSKEKEYGVYTYNDATKSLSYKYDDNKYYQSAMVNVISVTEMNVTTDWGSVGRMTQYFVRVK